MTPCTIEKDTVCFQRCISKENYYEESSDDCQKCWWCCGDGNDVVKDECLSKGMPRQQSCTIHRRKICKAPVSDPPTEIPTITLTTIRRTMRVPSTPFPVVTTTDHDPADPPMDKESGTNREPDNKLHMSTTVLVLIILTAVFISIAIGASLNCFISKLRNRRCNQIELPAVQYQNQHNILNNHYDSGENAGEQLLANGDQHGDADQEEQARQNEQANPNEQAGSNEPLIVNLPADTPTIGNKICVCAFCDLSYSQNRCIMTSKLSIFIWILGLSARYARTKHKK